MNYSGKKAIKAIICILIDIVSIFAGYILFTYLTKDHWFLRHENHPFSRFLMIAAIILGILGIVILNIVLLSSILKKGKQDTEQLEAKEAEQLKGGDAEGQIEAHSAADFVQLFQAARNEKPRLAPLMEKAIDQIETFEEDKDSIKRIMRLQDISYAPIVHAIDHAEDSMMKVLRSIHIDISIWNPKHLDNEERRDSYIEIYNSIEEKLEINRKNLKSFHDLLMRVRTLKTEEIAEDNTIQALVKALESTAR